MTDSKLTQREQNDYLEIRAAAQVLIGHLRTKKGWPTEDSAYDLSSDGDRNLLQRLVRAVDSESRHLSAELDALPKLYNETHEICTMNFCNVRAHDDGRHDMPGEVTGFGQ